MSRRGDPFEEFLTTCGELVIGAVIFILTIGLIASAALLAVAGLRVLSAALGF